MPSLLDKLKGGDRRSIGRSDEVVQDILSNPALFSVVFTGMLHEDPVVRMRSADAAEKITAKRPELLHPHKNRLLELASTFPEKEMRWHVAQMIPRLRLTKHEQDTAVTLLLGYLRDNSSIVKTFSMQALGDLAMQHHRLLGDVLPLLDRLTLSGTPAMAARGRMLLKRLRVAAADASVLE